MSHQPDALDRAKRTQPARIVEPKTPSFWLPDCGLINHIPCKTATSTLKLPPTTHIRLILHTIRILKARQLDPPHIPHLPCPRLLNFIFITIVALPIPIAYPPKRQYRPIFQPRTLRTVLNVRRTSLATRRRGCLSLSFTLRLLLFILRVAVFPLAELKALVRVVDVDGAAELDV